MVNQYTKAEFEILYNDKDYIAINKPPGYLVHRSPIAKGVETIVLQALRDQIQQRVFPIHRLDRKTSGVLLFGLNSEATKEMAGQFSNHEVVKEYIAIVRGWTEDHGIIDYDLINDDGKKQNAISHYKTIERFEINLPHGKFDTSRYSKVKLTPQTGRMHQLRKHMSHIFHPIIGDRPHGCNKQNRLWKHTFDMTHMMLHADSLVFNHPFKHVKVEIKAPLFDEFERVLQILEPQRI